MPRYLRLRYLLLYFLIYWAYAHLDARWVLERPVTRGVSAALARAGFPDNAFTIDTLTFSHLALSHIRLDSEGVNTIDRVDVTYSLWTVLWGRVRDIAVEKPDFVFSADAPPPLPWGRGEDHSSSPSRGRFLLSTLPFQTLSVRGLSVAWAGDTMNPGVTGTVMMRANAEGNKQLTFAFKGAQKDLSVDIKGTVVEDHDRNLRVLLDVPEARFDIPGVLMMSRAHGTFDITIPDDAPISANGEWVAGAMRVGTFPLDNISVVVQGRKPDFSLIGNADVTGVSQSNISLRLAEDAHGAQLIAQVSGTSPQQFLKRAMPSSDIPLPDHQKFVVTLDMKDSDLPALFTAPYTGGLFLYDDAATPSVSVAMACETGGKDCVFKLPPTTLKAAQINAFAEAILADAGLMIAQGNVTLSGSIAPMGSPAPSYAFQIGSKNLDLNWQGADFTGAQFNVARSEAGAYQIGPFSAHVMEGDIQTEPLSLSLDGAGRTVLSMKNVDLSAVSDFVKVEGLEVSGRASGTVPITFSKFKPALDRGGRISGVRGTIKYAPEQYPSFLGGADNRMKVLRDTLQDYTFDTMTLDFAGDPFGTVSATLAAKGRNESLFKDRPVHINLKIDGPLAPALQQLIPYVGADTVAEEGATE